MFKSLDKTKIRYTQFTQKLQSRDTIWGENSNSTDAFTKLYMHTTSTGSFMSVVRITNQHISTPEQLKISLKYQYVPHLLP